VRVRKAIAQSIDYVALRDKVLRGNAVLLNGLIPPGVPGYDPAAPEPSRDVAGARALLAAAGHPNGVDLSMIVGEPGPVAELIQANLADAGIRLRLQRMAPSAIDAARGTGDYEVFYDGWILDFPDPFIFLNLAFSTPAAGGVGNFSHYANPAADGLLQAAMVEADPAKRTSLYRQAQNVIMQDQPIVPLFAPKLVFVQRSSLTGVRINPYQPNYLDIAAMGRAPSPSENKP
jgi:ABC-type transport system substrate-binding protein